MDERGFPRFRVRAGIQAANGGEGWVLSRWETVLTLASPRALQPESNAEHRIIVCTPTRGNGEFWKKLSFSSIVHLSRKACGGGARLYTEMRTSDPPAPRGLSCASHRSSWPPLSCAPPPPPTPATTTGRS